MSYAAIEPQVYEIYQPDTPWHAGAPGWSTAPVPGWGQNPLLRGPRRKATQGLGCGGSCQCSSQGVGAYYATEPLAPILPGGGSPAVGSYYEGHANLPMSGSCEGNKTALILAIGGLVILMGIGIAMVESRR